MLLYNYSCFKSNYLLISLLYLSSRKKNNNSKVSQHIQCVILSLSVYLSLCLFVSFFPPFLSLVDWIRPGICSPLGSVFQVLSLSHHTPKTPVYPSSLSEEADHSLLSETLIPSPLWHSHFLDLLILLQLFPSLLGPPLIQGHRGFDFL